MSKQFADSSLPETLFDPEILYNLLPTLYLERDQQQSESLRSLLAVLTQEFAAIARDVQHLYDNWFIETCDEWVVPYIAELVGVRGLVDESHLAYSQRACVANTLRYRQRKGTPATLEQAAKDSTGWAARAVEGFTQLAITQSLSHLHSAQSTISLRDPSTLDALGTPFGAIAHGLDVRPQAASPMTTTARFTQGGYSLGGLTLFLWRLQSYPVTCSTPAADPAGGYTFHPLGVSTNLFNAPLTTSAADQRTEARTVPAPLRRRPLREAIAALQQGADSPVGYFNDQPVFEIWVRSHADQPDFEPIAATAIQIADLSERSRPITFSEGIKAMVDPVFGRFLLSEKLPPDQIRVSYVYGFSADLGGGAYDRPSSTTPTEADLWQAIVSQDAMVDCPPLNDGNYVFIFQSQEAPIALPPLKAGEQYIFVFQTLTSALQAWSTSGQNGFIQILDNGTYGSPDTHYAITPTEARLLVIQSANGTCPCILGNWRVQGNSAGTSVTLNGLWLDGQLTVQGNLQLNLQHCTLKPPLRTADASTKRPSIQSAGHDNLGLQIAITRCITGPLHLLPEMAGLWVQDSIIDGGGGNAIAATYTHSSSYPYSAPTILKRTTILGRVFLSSLLLASDVIFADPVYVQHQQVGALRFCYLPLDSQTPRQTPRCYHCQPDMATHGQLDDVRQTIATQLKPTFTSVVYGHPGYAQLSLSCPLDIRSGGTQGSEMGTFHHLFQFQREIHLSEMLREYLPCNLAAGVVYVT